MQSQEASSPRKTRKKATSKPTAQPSAVAETDSLEPPQFAQPGTPFSVPEDRELTTENVDAELAAAKSILDGNPAESETMEPSADEIDETDPVAEMLCMQTESIIENQIANLLISIEEISKSHAVVARANGYHAMAGDLTALGHAGRHLAKRLKLNRYWVKR